MIGEIIADKSEGLKVAWQQLYCDYCRECPGPVETDEGWYCEGIGAPRKLGKSATRLSGLEVEYTTKEGGSHNAGQLAGRWPFNFMPPSAARNKPSEVDLMISEGMSQKMDWPESLRAGNSVE
jgi:hypothetical protein